jgi:acyl-CoA dehydrogenase
MDFAYSPRAEALRTQLTRFMEDHVIPRHGRWLAQSHAGIYPISFMDDLKALARDEGLWNLFLPHLKDDEPGTRLSNLDYAPLAEIMGRLPWASEVFNCNAPDTGNMELLHMFATPEQKAQWLVPLMAGDIRSCFSMTEPDVASSDATNITTSIVRDGDEYVINGRKWFITGAANLACKLTILMGKTDPRAEPHRQQSMVLIPMDAPGVTVVRNITVMNHTSHIGHCEVVYRNVRVPVNALLGGEGDGFMLAQARLGPGRIHHCMRAIGEAELALELMAARALERKAFGLYLVDQGMVQDAIARSRCEIEQTRLLVLKTAWMIDELGVKAARNEISMIKVLAPSMLQTIADRAIQIFGAMGLSPDTPLADIWTSSRTLRIVDGPDAVHLRTIARREIRAAKERAGSMDQWLTPPDRGDEADIRALAAE